MTEEEVLLFEVEKSFGENKSLMVARGESSSFEEFGKVLWFSKSLMFDLSQILKRVPEEPLHQQLLWFSPTGEKSSESSMRAHFHKNKGSLLGG